MERGAAMPLPARIDVSGVRSFARVILRGASGLGTRERPSEVIASIFIVKGTDGTGSFAHSGLY